MESKKGKEAESTFNGAYGFVIKPDEKTAELARNLAGEVAPGAEFLVEAPHITLYHAKFENLPKEAVKSILDKIKSANGKTLKLGRFYVYGGKFVFWDVENIDEIRQIHEETLASAKYLNRAAAAKSVEEGLDLNPEEMTNVQKFGHPLVMGRFTPHISLAYNGQGITLPAGIKERKHEMKIEKVLFAEMGKYGSVQKIFDL